jgi:hypothetical protein
MMKRTIDTVLMIKPALADGRSYVHMSIKVIKRIQRRAIILRETFRFGRGLRCGHKKTAPKVGSSRFAVGRGVKSG